MSAFTKRLAQINAEQIPVQKLRDKFANDTEFRTYVTRFVRQFEDLYEQALANDHGELLGTTFASSDTGRLYLILCAASGRDPKLMRDERLAA